MPKQMSTDDFRAVRYILTDDDFGLISEELEPDPTDLIDPETWHSIVDIADDVSIRTSNHFGSVLKEWWDIWGEYGRVVLVVQAAVTNPASSPLAHTLSDAADEIQGSIQNALTGYYRLAFSGLRNIVEHTTIGMQLELSGDQPTFQDWLIGDAELGMGKAADQALGHPRVQAVEAQLQAVVADDLLRRRNRLTNDPGGYGRRLFGALSAYTHGGPGYTDADMRQSNGPIFVPATFAKWSEMLGQAVEYSIIMARLAMPSLSDLNHPDLEETELTLKSFFDVISDGIGPNADGRNVVQGLPANFW